MKAKLLSVLLVLVVLAPFGCYFSQVGAQPFTSPLAPPSLPTPTPPPPNAAALLPTPVLSQSCAGMTGKDMGTIYREAQETWARTTQQTLIYRGNVCKDATGERVLYETTPGLRGSTPIGRSTMTWLNWRTREQMRQADITGGVIGNIVYVMIQQVVNRFAWTGATDGILETLSSALNDVLPPGLGGVAAATALCDYCNEQMGIWYAKFQTSWAAGQAGEPGAFERAGVERAMSVAFGSAASVICPMAGKF